MFSFLHQSLSLFSVEPNIRLFETNENKLRNLQRIKKYLFCFVYRFVSTVIDGMNEKTSGTHSYYCNPSVLGEKKKKRRVITIKKNKIP